MEARPVAEAGDAGGLPAHGQGPVGGCTLISQRHNGDGARQRGWFPPGAFQRVQIVAHFAKGYGWAVPVLAALSVATSLAETLAISIVVLFLYVLIGPGVEAANASGLLLRIFETAGAVAGEGALSLAILVLALVTIKASLRVTYELLAAAIKNAVSERVRNAIYDQYLHLPYGYLRSREQGDLVNVLANESWDVAEAFYFLTRIGTNLAAFVVFAAMLLAVSWQVTLLAAIGALVTFTALRFLAGPTQRLGNVTVKANQALAGQMVNTLYGMRAIRAYSQEGFRQERFHRSSREVRQAMRRLDQLHSVIAPVSEIVLLGLLAGIVWLSTSWGLPFASVLAGIALLYRLQPHLREFESNRLKLARLAAPLESVWSVVNAPPAGPIPSGVLPFRRLQKAIRFERVSMTYPEADRPSLSEASFTIPKGTKTAIMGRSGAGKSTIVNLLLRLYEPTGGSILVDDVPLATLDRASWLSGLAVAGQDAELIEDTIIANIRLARPEASQAEIEQAAELACILDFIRTLPQGLETWIGEQGVNLSGGQRQRIGLARALLRQPQILILDEATNDLDAELEQRIRRNVTSVMAHGTLVVVTHQLETIRDADHVIRVEGGRVVAEGSAVEVISGDHAVDDCPPKDGCPPSSVSWAEGPPETAETMTTRGITARTGSRG